MKILIFSDSHRNLAPMLQIVAQEAPDEIFHLGDLVQDAQELSYAFPRLPVTMVPGNCDGWTGLSDQLLVEREGVRLLMGHGHLWRVKSGPEAALRAAREANADVLLYGHTHRALCRREGELWLLNPGTVGGRWEPASYGVIHVEQGTARCALYPVAEG